MRVISAYYLSCTNASSLLLAAINLTIDDHNCQQRVGLFGCCYNYESHVTDYRIVSYRVYLKSELADSDRRCDEMRCGTISG